MVRFDKESYTIEVTTGTNPVPEWAELHSAIIERLGMVDKESLAEGQLWVISDFLTQMMPDEETLRKMCD